MTKKFDSLVESILNEMTPATAEYDPSSMGSTVSQKVSNLPKESQHWKYLQKLNPELRTKIVKEIIENVFTDNEDHTYSLTIDNVEDLKDAIRKAIIIVAKANETKDFNPTSETLINFLVDRLANKELLGKVTYTTMSGEEADDKKMTQKEVNQTLRKALEKPPVDGNGEDEEEEDLEVEAEEEVEKKASYNPRADYYLKSYEEMPAGKLAGDVRVAYDRLSGMSGEVHSGSDFVKQLEKSGLGASHVKQLLDLGILEPADEEISDAGDTEGFKETEEEYIDRITRAAREDYRSADLNPKYGGIQFD